MLKKIAKGPLFLTTALFLATPMCMAEAATASSVSSFGLDRPQYQSQTALNTLKQSLPRTSQGLRLLPFSSIPSLGDINTLESTLSKLETQLKNLKNQTPAVKPERLAQISSKIATLKATISDSKEAYSTYLKASEALKKALSNQTTTQASYELAVVAEATAGTSLTAKQDALAALEAIKASKTTSLANLQQLLNNTKLAADIADASLTEQKQVKANAEAALAIRQEQYITTSAKLSSAQQTFNEASLEVEAAAEQLNAANQTLVGRQQTLDQAQRDYNTKLIPDPTWAHPTYQQERTRIVQYTELVPRTTYVTQGGIFAEMFNRRGFNNAPPLPTPTEVPVFTGTVPRINFQWGGGNILNTNYSEDVIVRFSGNIVVPENGFYRFQSPADDGTQMLLNGQLITSDWRDKGGGGTTSNLIYLEAGALNPFVLHYYENGGGAAIWLNAHTPSSGFILVPASWYATTVQEVTTYEEVIKTREEIYYTTELVPNQTAPLIKDPARLLTLNEALTDFNNASMFQEEKQVAYSSRLLTKDAANNSLEASQSAYDETQANKLEAEDTLEFENLELNRLTTSNEAAQSELTTASNNAAVGIEELTTAANNVTTASSEVAAAELELSRTTNEKAAAATSLKDSSSEVTAAQGIETKTSSAASALNLEATTRATETQQDLSTASSDTAPEPEPIPEEGSKEIPAELTAENLLEVNLEEVDPTELTEAQAEQLVEAALETFETAVEGSPEYEQALDALYLSAEQDDIELPAELSAIPGLAGAIEALNFLGNAGADMSPKVREESEKVVVAAVIAAGAAIQSAAAAASTASASSGGSRRIGK